MTRISHGKNYTKDEINVPIALSAFRDGMDKIPIGTTKLNKTVNPYERFQSEGHVNQNVTEHAGKSERREATQCRPSRHGQSVL